MFNLNIILIGFFVSAVFMFVAWLISKNVQKKHRNHVEIDNLKMDIISLIDEAVGNVRKTRKPGQRTPLNKPRPGLPTWGKWLMGFVWLPFIASFVFAGVHGQSPKSGAAATNIPVKTTITTEATLKTQSSLTSPAHGVSSPILGMPVVSAGGEFTVGLKSDGTVVAVGSNVYGQCNVSSWTDITRVAAGSEFTIGLKSDGTVVAVGINSEGQCDISSWTGIIQVAAGYDFSVGLKADGTVVAVGDNDYGQCSGVSSWTGITQVAAGEWQTVGLKTDGTVVAVGNNQFGQCDVSPWNGITQIAAGDEFTIGLKSGGTAVAVGNNPYGECNVGSWMGITKVAVGMNFTVGLKSNGTVVAVGYDGYGQCGGVSPWTGITQLAAGGEFTVGLKSDGTVVAVGNNSADQCNTSSWNLSLNSTITTASLASPTTSSPTSLMPEPNAPADLVVGSSQQFLATETYSNGRAGDITEKVASWSSSNPNVATISSSGLATAIEAGNTNITFILNGITSSPVGLTVVSSTSTTSTTTTTMPEVTLFSIEVTPNPPSSLAISSLQQFDAIGTYSDGSTADITSQVTWASSNTTVATISSDGLATAAGAGTANITASVDGITSPPVGLPVIATVVTIVTTTPIMATSPIVTNTSQIINYSMPGNGILDFSVWWTNNLDAGNDIKGTVSLSGSTPAIDWSNTWTFEIDDPLGNVIFSQSYIFSSGSIKTFDFTTNQGGTWKIKVSDASDYSRTLQITILPAGWH